MTRFFHLFWCFKNFSGKSSGHDLDVLFSYPERKDGDYGLIAAVLDELNKKDLVVWSRAVRTDGPRKVIELDSSPLSSGSTNDHLPTMMIIFKYPLDDKFDEFERRDLSGRCCICATFFSTVFNN